jgi:hypothetical protein
MTNPVRLWICAAHHPAFRCCGWAYVRIVEGQASGAAGGRRYTTARAMALAGLAAALSDLPPESPVSVYTTSQDLIALAEVFSGAVAPDPTDEDWALIAPILALARNRPLTLIAAPRAPDTPIAFAAAWADLAMDKAKAMGPFSAAIPKPNLAKARGLTP